MYSTAPDLIPQAEGASDRAVAADPSLGEGHVARAMIHDIQATAELPNASTSWQSHSTRATHPRATGTRSSWEARASTPRR
jgi:hypothetical protein